MKEKYFLCFSLETKCSYKWFFSCNNGKKKHNKCSLLNGRTSKRSVFQQKNTSIFYLFGDLMRNNEPKKLKQERKKFLEKKKLRIKSREKEEKAKKKREEWWKNMQPCNFYSRHQNCLTSQKKKHINSITLNI